MSISISNEKLSYWTFLLIGTVICIGRFVKCTVSLSGLTKDACDATEHFFEGTPRQCQIIFSQIGTLRLFSEEKRNSSGENGTK